MASSIDQIDLENLNVLPILERVSEILETLDTVGRGIISSIDQEYRSFCLTSGYLPFNKTLLKKIDSFKDSTATKIRRIRKDVWDDYWDFVKIAADLMDDIPDYQNIIKDLKTTKELISSYSPEFKVYQLELWDKRGRQGTACENRIKKYIDGFNEKVRAFNYLNGSLTHKDIVYKGSRVSYSSVLEEFNFLTNPARLIIHTNY